MQCRHFLPDILIIRIPRRIVLAHYFLGALIKAYRELEERVGSIKKTKGYKTEQIITAVSNKIGISPFNHFMVHLRTKL